ncbi:MAG: HlyD family efflux transporter periplasmic adaptor subunit [Cellvibrionaceae bacterium]|nr:HlyD family efflux transporter periplasmic adaptor subunit [Cellvibrionaceae bacterium]
MLSKLKSNTLWISLAGLGLLMLSLAYTVYAIENRPEPEKYQEAQRKVLVTVEAISVGAHQGRVFANAEVRPKYEMSLSSELSARVESLHPLFETGRVLSKGTSLLKVDALRFQQEYAQAQQNLAQANLNLQLEKQESKQALLEWQESGFAKAVSVAKGSKIAKESKGSKIEADDLRLRKPQLQLAQAEVEQAAAALKLAKQNLDRTEMRLPFDAVISERLVAPGQFLQAGQAVATIYSANDLELTVMLKPSEWQLLFGANHSIENYQANIILSGDDGSSWQAKIARAGQTFDRQTRLRPLVLRVVQDPKQEMSLLSGNFVGVEIPGRVEQGLMAVAASSVSSCGDLWYVDTKKRLRSFSADIAFQHKGTVYVRPPAGLASQSLDILSSPLPHYVNGQQVEVQRLNQLAVNRRGAAQ